MKHHGRVASLWIVGGIMNGGRALSTRDSFRMIEESTDGVFLVVLHLYAVSENCTELSQRLKTD